MKIHLVKYIDEDIGSTYCGIDENYSEEMEEKMPFTKNVFKVTCKKCLKSFKKEMKWFIIK